MVLQGEIQNAGLMSSNLQTVTAAEAQNTEGDSWSHPVYISQPLSSATPVHEEAMVAWLDIMCGLYRMGSLVITVHIISVATECSTPQMLSL